MSAPGVWLICVSDRCPLWKEEGESRSWILSGHRSAHCVFLSVFICSSRITTTTWTWRRPTVPCSLLVMWVCLTSFFFFLLHIKITSCANGNSTGCKHTVWYKCRQVQWRRSSSWYPVLCKSSQKSYLSKDTVSMYYFCESPIHIVLVCKLCTWWWVGIGFVSFRIVKPDQSSSLTFSIILIIRISVW